MRTNFSFLLVLINLSQKIAKERKHVCSSRVTCTGCVIIFLKLDYMKRLWLLGFSHSVCSKEVQDMFYVFLCIQLNKKQNPDVWPLIWPYLNNVPLPINIVFVLYLRTPDLCSLSGMAPSCGQKRDYRVMQQQFDTRSEYLQTYLVCIVEKVIWQRRQQVLSGTN